MAAGSPLDAYSQVVAGVAAELTPKVASLRVPRTGSGGAGESLGSAVVYTGDGFLLTNAHVVGQAQSGTALFAYALGWGVNNGILDAKKFTPTVTKAWNALTTKALQPSGLLGYVQGDATGPRGAQPVKATDTAAYGVGAYLMAGQQVAKLTPGC